MTEFLPHIRQEAVDAGRRFTPQFYDALRRSFAGQAEQIRRLESAQAAVDAILKSLGAEDVAQLEDLGSLLSGKQDASQVLDQLAQILGVGLVARSGTGFRTRAIQPVAGQTTVSNGNGLAGDPAVGLADLADSGTGTLLAITRDAKGRVSGTKAATITGTAGRVTVANGDASAGLPTVDLATVADGGGGTLLRIVRDAWGRITGTSAPTTSDLAEGTNLYHTAQRVRDTVLEGLSTATNAVIAATDTVLSALGKLQAQISGLIVQTITDGDTTHAPSGDAVFDALALKTTNSAAAITGGTINGASVGATTPASGAFTSLSSVNDAAFNNTTVGRGGGNVSGNIVVGAGALANNTTGNNLVAIGVNALATNSTGGNNVAIGTAALNKNTAPGNIAIGALALQDNDGGTFNVAIGERSLQRNVSGSYSVAIGRLALVNNTASNNTGIGYTALQVNTSGAKNTAIGYEAGGKNTTGSNNIYIGFRAGITGTSDNANASGNSNTFIGHEAGPGTTTQISLATAIGALATVTTSNTVVLGRPAENVVIGATGVDGSGAKLQVTGAIKATTTIRPGSYTVATVPSASAAGAGAMIYVSDEVGGGVPAFSDGTDWRRVTDRAIVS